MGQRCNKPQNNSQTHDYPTQNTRRAGASLDNALHGKCSDCRPCNGLDAVENHVNAQSLFEDSSVFGQDLVRYEE